MVKEERVPFRLRDAASRIPDRRARGPSVEPVKSVYCYLEMSKPEYPRSRFTQGVDHHGPTNCKAKIVNRFLETRTTDQPSTFGSQIGSGDSFSHAFVAHPREGGHSQAALYRRALACPDEMKFGYLCAPEFNLIGARMREAYATWLGSVHLPGEARRTHVRRSHHLSFYDPKVEGRQVTRV
ncbi:hypothetical protein CRG98_029273 [Punica granatum]|uniref:Uncharacterized protein n=1 Tax=Punica granatum TaxID=22663 RepID=A0A2I0J275_PUNGR|nr:hypothetical protein CRG98_029273 [Punica granatum]